jgi:hypothetical protein
MPRQRSPPRLLVRLSILASPRQLLAATPPPPPPLSALRPLCTTQQSRGTRLSGPCSLRDGASACSRHRQWHRIHKNGVRQRHTARIFPWLTCACSFAGNDSPSFVFPTAIATRQAPGSSSNRPAPPSKPSFLASGSSGSTAGHLASKRGTEDLDFFIGDEAIQANSGAGYGLEYPIRHGIVSDWSLMER